jgi:putative endonuclease
MHSRRYHEYFVYMMTKVSGMLYIGMTNNITRRVHEHKTKVNESFTSKYNLTKLVYFESHRYVNDAIAREKQLKGWLRARKVALVNEMNPEWKDLAADWYEDEVERIVSSERRDPSLRSG